jgi:hypothetical protein
VSGDGPGRGPSSERRKPPHTPAAGRPRSEIDVLLDQPGCPTCGFVEQYEQSFFSWFEIENHATAEMRAALRSAMGMCPEHWRRLIDEVEEASVLAPVSSYGVAGALDHIAGAGVPGACPACSARAFATSRASRMLIETLDDRSCSGRYASHAGLCLTHFRDAAGAAGPATLTLLSERMSATLDDPHTGGSGQSLIGLDTDSRRRCTWRQALPSALAAPTTLSTLEQQLLVSACPVCLAIGQSERRYLEWIVEAIGDRDRSLNDDPGELCAAHIHDLALSDPGSALWAMDRRRASSRGVVRRLLDILAAQPTVGSANRGQVWGRKRSSGPSDLEAARTAVLDLRPCRACSTGTIAERRALELLGIALELPELTAAYERGHGLCARHAVQLSPGASHDLAARHAGTRLRLIAWELDEARRKSAWSCRHEPAGPELTAWLRAPSQIDGRVFLGGPAEPVER